MKSRAAIISIIIAILLLGAKFLLPKPIQFSPLVSIIVAIILGLALIAILVLTVKGKFIERRIVFVFVGVALVLPFFMQFRLPMRVTPEVQAAFDALAALPPGSKVLTAFDYDPPSAPELQPMADAFMKFAFERDLDVIIIGLWPQGPQQANQSVEAAFEANPALAERIKYGIDYVNLGFQSGADFVILRMGQSFKSMFAVDQRYTPYDSIPLLKNIRNFSNIDLAFNFSSGKVGTVEWIQVAVDRYGLKLIAGNTAVQAPQVYPYLNSGQLLGLVGGMTGAAEFEFLTGKLGKAQTFILSQTFAHLVVIAFIITGNVAYFQSRWEKRK